MIRKQETSIILAASKRLLLLAICLTALSNSALSAEIQGQTPNGAYYTISVPENWQSSKGLVIWNHGYQGYTQAEPEPNPSLGPLEAIILEQGYALAASSFSQTGWALFNSHIDNQELYAAFTERYGEPEKLFLQGGSMGGAVTIRDLEAGLIPEADGALLLCGATAGSSNWYNALDLRVIYEAICNDVSNGKLPTENWYETPQAITGELGFLGSLAACVGVFPDEVSPTFADFARSSSQRERLNRILSLSGVSKEFLLLDLGYAVFEIPNLVKSNNKLAGNKPFSNTGVDYGDEEINLLAKRDFSLPASRRKLEENYTPSGNIGATKIISIHTSGDGLVKVENQSVLAEILPAPQYREAVVREETPSHCGFSENEVISAWNSLKDWVEGSNAPSVEQIQQRCLSENGSEELCRFDPAFQTSTQLLSFPRDQLAAVIGNNDYFLNTNSLELHSIKVIGESDNYDLSLSATLGSLSTFEVKTITTSPAPESWQHQSTFFPDDSLLYIPRLRINPPTSPEQSFNLYMKLQVDDKTSAFTVLEYEESEL